MRQESNYFSHDNIEQFPRRQQGSLIESLKNGLQYNSKILLGVGLACVAAGATLYLLRTERGKDLSSQITSTVTDGVTRVQESVSDVVSKVKGSVMQLANRWSGDIRQTEWVNPATAGDRLRRVI